MDKLPVLKETHAQTLPLLLVLPGYIIIVKRVISLNLPKKKEKYSTSSEGYKDIS